MFDAKVCAAKELIGFAPCPKDQLTTFVVALTMGIVYYFEK